MLKLVHGGDVYTLGEEYAGPILDFSANINPLGMPEGVQKAAAAALDRCARYPDPLCRELRGVLSKAVGVPGEYILCGNGAADLIFRLALAERPRRAVIPMPTFAEYAQALETVDCRVEPHWLREEEDFLLTPAILDVLTPGVDLLCLCTPNNPTGQPVPLELLEQILLRCRENGIRVLLDECFVSFLDDPEGQTIIPRLREFPNLVVLRAFTKLYAMAGLRLGFCLSADLPLLERMARSAQPWAVSIPAQAAGVAALGEEDYRRRTRELIPREREYLREGLAALGLRVVGSHANYLFFRCPWPDFSERLRRRGILVRDCGNYPGLDKGWFRIAVRTREENQRLLEAIQKIREGTA